VNELSRYKVKVGDEDQNNRKRNCCMKAKKNTLLFDRRVFLVQVLKIQDAYVKLRLFVVRDVFRTRVEHCNHKAENQTDGGRNERLLLVEFSKNKSTHDAGRTPGRQ
jgi:hypothetical protein